jgi:hypothetical protein
MVGQASTTVAKQPIQAPDLARAHGCMTGLPLAGYPGGRRDGAIHARPDLAVHSCLPPNALFAFLPAFRHRPGQPVAPI